MLDGVKAVDVTRGPRVESTHSVAACACDDRGSVVVALGSIDVPVYLRSAAKPFIAAAIVRAGAVERFHLHQREIAVIAGSHQGEPRHVEAVAAILAKIGVDERQLECGVHAPYSELAAAQLAAEGVAPTQLHNNCSGKHAGILALARLRGHPVEGYLQRTHPVQREILGFCERMFDDRFVDERIGIDGCGIPAFATTLAKTARAFARLATLRGFDAEDARALRTVRDAMTEHPWYVAGSRRFDTDLIEAGGGSLLAKSGAEGVHACAASNSGLGLALKVVDGARRAVAPATIALLRRAGMIGPDDERSLCLHARGDVFNVAGKLVGHVQARPEL